MHGPVLAHRASGRDERLARHLATEHPLQGHLGAQAAEDVLLDRFEVEQANQAVDDGLPGAVSRCATGNDARLSGHS